MAVRAIGFRAILSPQEVETTTKGGLVLALDERLEMNAQVVGTIVELGPDFAKDYKPSLPAWGLKAGDKVFYARYAGKWIKDPATQKEYLVVNDEDIVAKVEETEDASPVLATKEA